MKVINIFLGSIGFLSNISFGALPQEQLNIRDRTTLMKLVSDAWDKKQSEKNVIDQIEGLTPIETMFFWGLSTNRRSNVSPRGVKIRSTVTQKIKKFIGEELGFSTEELAILRNGTKTERLRLKSKKLNQIKEICEGNDLVWTVIDENVYGTIDGWKEMINCIEYTPKAQRRAISLDGLN